MTALVFSILLVVLPRLLEDDFQIPCFNYLTIA